MTIGKRKIGLIKGGIGLVLVLGALIVGITQLPKLLAFNDTDYTWNFNVGTSGAYTFDTNYVTVNSNGAEPVAGLNKLINPSFNSDVDSWNIAAVSGSSTPNGWIVVPGDSAQGTADFLAMKYDAKCADIGNTGVGLTAPAHAASHVYQDNGDANNNRCTADKDRAVVSVASGYPIAYVDQSESNRRCGSIVMGVGSSAHLMTNSEWMTVANNVLVQSNNWSGNAVGSGYLYAGHNDNKPSFALPASENDAYRAAYTDDDGLIEALSSATNLAYGASGTAGNQVRTLYLSNGQVIWDFGGNIRQWTNDTIMGVDKPVGAGSTAAWMGWNTINNWGTLSSLVTRPATVGGTEYYASGYGVGQYYQGSDVGSTAFGFIRGGYWYNTSNAGAFTCI